MLAKVDPTKIRLARLAREVGTATIAAGENGKKTASPAK